MSATPSTTREGDGDATASDDVFTHVFCVERRRAAAAVDAADDAADDDDDARARSRFVDFETYDASRRDGGAACSRARSALRRMDGRAPCAVRIDREALRAKIVAAERMRTEWLRDATTKTKTTTKPKRRRERVKSHATTKTTAATTTTTTTTTMTTTHGAVVRAKARANGPYYRSRTFVAMDEPPREDSDDEDPVPQEIAEDTALMHEFVDFSQEEIDFMLAWNVVSRRYRALCDDDVPGLLKAFVRANFASLRGNARFYNMFVAAATGMFEHGVVNRQGLVDALKLARKSRNLKLFEPPATFAASRVENNRAPTRAKSKPKSVGQNLMPIDRRHERALADERSTPICPETSRDDGVVVDDDDDIRKSKKPKPSTRTRLTGPCALCPATQRPCWRSGPHHAPVLCDTCGMRWARKGSAEPLRVETRPEVAPSTSSPTTPPGEDDHGAFAHPWNSFTHVYIKE